MDTIGPIKSAGLKGEIGALLVTDAASKYRRIHSFTFKSCILDYIFGFCRRIATHIHLFLKYLHSDEGTEFISYDLLKFYQNNGIHVKFSSIIVQQLHRSAERNNRTTLETMRSFLVAANLPEYF